MGLPRIIYNSKNVDFLDMPRELQKPVQRVRGVSRAKGGKATEVLTFRSEAIVSVSFPYQDDATLRRKLEQWLAWASKGNAWQFAFDRDDTVKTTINATAAAGASAVVVASATGIVQDREYL